MPDRRQRAFFAVLAAGTLAACSTFGTRVGGTTADEPSATVPRELAADGLAAYLQTMHDLIEGDAVLKADVFRNAENAAEYSPTTTNRLNFALALATPGHPATDAAEAQRLLRNLLAEQGLLPHERVLATIHLQEAEQRLILDAEARRLQEEMERAIAESNAANTERLQTTLDENRRLRAELEDAQQKLDAITNIERSIRERENGAN